MMNRTLRMLVVLVGLVAPAGAGAVSLTLTDSGPYVVGNTVLVDVGVGPPGLGNFAPASVREFDFDVSFDTLRLSFLSLTFDSFLGTPGTQALITGGDVGGGTVDLKSVSLLAAATLDGLQPSAFRLATLRFTALNTGLATFSFTQTDIGDTAGVPFTVTPPSALIVTIGAAPEPGTWLLCALALCAIAAWRPHSSA